MEIIRHFNGNLFTDGPILTPTRDEIEEIRRAARLDWSAIDPSIFGTLFERGMDPDKRSQLGAHYTSREDIETLVEPVVMQPLRREWARPGARSRTSSPPASRSPRRRTAPKVPAEGLTGMLSARPSWKPTSSSRGSGSGSARSRCWTPPAARATSSM